MSRGETLQKFLEKNKMKLFFLLFWLWLMIDFGNSQGDLQKILFSNIVIFLGLEWVFDEVQIMRKEFKNFFRNEIDKAVIDALNLREKERRLNK